MYWHCTKSLAGERVRLVRSVVRLSAVRALHVVGLAINRGAAQDRPQVHTPAPSRQDSDLVTVFSSAIVRDQAPRALLRL